MPGPCFINLSERCRNNSSGNKRTDDKLLAHGVFWQAGVFPCPMLFTCFLGDLVHGPRQVYKSKAAPAITILDLFFLFHVTVSPRVLTPYLAVLQSRNKFSISPCPISSSSSSLLSIKGLTRRQFSSQTPINLLYTFGSLENSEFSPLFTASCNKKPY